MTVESIKRAIELLPSDQQQSLAQWLNELAYDEWDRQMVADFSPGGSGAALVERAKREIAEGRTVELSEGLAKAKARIDPSRQ